MAAPKRDVNTVILRVVDGIIDNVEVISTIYVDNPLDIANPIGHQDGVTQKFDDLETTEQDSATALVTGLVTPVLARVRPMSIVVAP